VSVNVKQVGVQDGVYVVPAWDVGHHEDSPNPGEPGNAVMNGHLETINAGHIFARLKDLKAGDAVYSYTSTQRLTWAVRESLTVPNTDREFLGPTSDRRLTLYTCTGTFNPITRDYSHRLVVVAALAETTARTVTGR
jgi:sortase A